MVRAYFDDSGTHGGSDVVVMGGLIGTEVQWAGFEQQWRARLAEPLPGKPPLRRFHMTDCHNRRDEFKDYSEAERDAVIHGFRQVIIESGVYGNAAAVSRADWDRIVAPTPMLLWFGDADGFCFRDCVGRLVSHFRHHPPPDGDLSFVLDDRPHRTAFHEFLYAQYQPLVLLTQSPLRLSEKLGFASSEQCMPLQGADMWAWENHYHARDWLKRGAPVEIRPHARQFFECGRFTVFVVGEREYNQIVALLGVPQA